MQNLWIDVDGDGTNEGYIGLRHCDDDYDGMFFELPQGGLRSGKILSHNQIDSMLESLYYAQRVHNLCVDREEAIEFLLAYCRENCEIVE